MDRLKQLWKGIRRWLLLKLAGGYTIVLNARVIGIIDNMDKEWDVVSYCHFTTPDEGEWKIKIVYSDPSYTSKLDRLYEQMLRENDGDHG